MVHSPLSMWRSNTASTGGGLRHMLILQILDVHREKALRHALYSTIGMRPYPLIRGGIKFQKTGSRRAMPPLADVPHLNAPGVVLQRIANRSSRKANRIPVPILRQSPASVRVSEVTEIKQIFFGRSEPFKPWSGAPPIPSAAERQARRMHPGAILHLLCRHKKRTSHY